MSLKYIIESKPSTKVALFFGDISEGTEGIIFVNKNVEGRYEVDMASKGYVRNLANSDWNRLAELESSYQKWRNTLGEIIFAGPLTFGDFLTDSLKARKEEIDRILREIRNADV